MGQETKSNRSYALVTSRGFSVAGGGHTHLPQPSEGLLKAKNSHFWFFEEVLFLCFWKFLCFFYAFEGQGICVQLFRASKSPPQKKTQGGCTHTHPSGFRTHCGCNRSTTAVSSGGYRSGLHFGFGNHGLLKPWVLNSHINCPVLVVEKEWIKVEWSSWRQSMPRIGDTSSP